MVSKDRKTYQSRWRRFEGPAEAGRPGEAAANAGCVSKVRCRYSALASGQWPAPILTSDPRSRFSVVCITSTDGNQRHELRDTVIAEHRRCPASRWVSCRITSDTDLRLLIAYLPYRCCGRHDHHSSFPLNTPLPALGRYEVENIRAFTCAYWRDNSRLKNLWHPRRKNDRSQRAGEENKNLTTP
jgi:hypothetical protein